jgi:hypothetical protein
LGIGAIQVENCDYFFVDILLRRQLKRGVLRCKYTQANFNTVISEDMILKYEKFIMLTDVV